MRANSIKKAALTSNGTVYYSENTIDWNDIVDISLDIHHLVGVRSDGTVVTVGHNYDGKYDGINKWRNIIAVYAYDGITIGVKDDGTTVLIGDRRIAFQGFHDMIALYPMDDELLGLRVDGIIISSNGETFGEIIPEAWVQ